MEGVEARRSHTLTFGSDGEASADPDALVDLLTDCIDAALHLAGPLAAGIAAVAGCSLAATSLGVDKTGRSACRTWIRIVATTVRWSGNNGYTPIWRLIAELRRPSVGKLAERLRGWAYTLKISLVQTSEVF